MDDKKGHPIHPTKGIPSIPVRVGIELGVRERIGQGNLTDAERKPMFPDVVSAFPLIPSPLHIDLMCIQKCIYIFP